MKLTSDWHIHSEHSCDGACLIVADLVSEAGSLSAEKLGEIRDIALKEPLLAQRLIAPDTEVTGVNVTLQFSGEDAAEVAETVAEARALAALASLGLLQANEGTDPWDRLSGWRLWSQARHYVALDSDGLRMEFEIEVRSSASFVVADVAAAIGAFHAMPVRQRYIGAAGVVRPK